MSTELAAMNWRDYVGRFSVEFEVANHEASYRSRRVFCRQNKCAGAGFRASWTRRPLG
jgi:hypothetical protein